MDNCVPIALFIHSKHLEFKCLALVATKTYEQMLFHYLCVVVLVIMLQGHNLFIQLYCEPLF